MKPFFSIVVPCCNVGQYICECLDSIQKQSFTAWECLCIIEDSTDDTETFVRSFAEKDFRFRVFTQPRSGSAALPRNVGMDNAIGEYIIFCDGDDSIAENSLEKLAGRMTEQPDADIYACAIWEYKDGGAYIRTIDNFVMKHPVELSGHDAVLLLYNYWKNPSPMLQENIWRRNFLNEHHLRCIPGLQHDDHEFFPRALYLAHRIVPLHTPFYLYRRQVTSITMAAKDPAHFHKHMAIVLKSLFAFHATESAKPGFDKRVAQCWAREWLRWVTFDWFYESSIRRIPRQKRLESLKTMLQNGENAFMQIARMDSFPRRVAACMICLFVRYSFCAWLVEAFFVKFYFPLAKTKNELKGISFHEHGEI